MSGWNTDETLWVDTSTSSENHALPAHTGANKVFATSRSGTRQFRVSNLGGAGEEVAIVFTDDASATVAFPTEAGGAVGDVVVLPPQGFTEILVAPAHATHFAVIARAGTPSITIASGTGV